MKKALVLVTLLAIVSAHAQVPVAKHNYEFANGSWFDGQKFVQKTFYSVAGVLSSKRPARIDRVFDLSGKYVVPPFGEAHNHNLDWSSDERFARINKMYLDVGIFYVKNPNSLLRSKEPTSARINLPNSIDGILSNGGLTGSGGHPIEIVTPQRGFKPEDGEGGFYYVIDTAPISSASGPLSKLANLISSRLTCFIPRSTRNAKATKRMTAGRGSIRRFSRTLCVALIVTVCEFQLT